MSRPPCLWCADRPEKRPEIAYNSSFFRSICAWIAAAAIPGTGSGRLARARRRALSDGKFGHRGSDRLLAHVAPLGWEHIALTGDYVWPATDDLTGFRPLREVPAAFLSEAA